MDREQILSYFDYTSGLRCLPNCLKSLHVPMVAALSDDELADFWQNRLRLVVEVIEPLADVPQHPFAETCIRLHDTPDIVRLAQILGQEISEDKLWHLYLLWANNLAISDSTCLICVAAFWSLPLPSAAVATVEASVAPTLAARSLHRLGQSEDAVWLLESYLGLLPEHYADADTLLSCLQRADVTLDDRGVPDTAATFLQALAAALRLTPGRSEDAVSLLDSYLELQPEHCTDADRLTLCCTTEATPMDREQILSYFDLASGLRCLPTCIKIVNRRGLLISALSNEELADYWQHGLRLVVEVIEPLTHIPQHPFAETCVTLHDVPDLESMAKMLKPEISEDDLHLFLKWANALKHMPASCLMCVTIHWSLPRPSAMIDADQESVALILAAQSLHALGRSSDAVWLLEDALDLRPKHYADAKRLASRLQLADSPLSGVAVDNVVMLLKMLATALHALQRSEDAALLLESYLGLSPEDYTNTNAMACRLQQADSPLSGVAVDRAVELLKTLVTALHALQRSEDAALLLESYLGLSPEDYTNTNEMASRLQRADSPLRHLVSNNAAVLLRVLAATLIDSVGRGGRDASFLLEGYLGLRPEDYTNTNAMASRLQRADSPLSGVAVDNVVMLLELLATALRFVAGRFEDGVLLLESYLGLSPGDYTDADTLSSRLKRADSPLSGVAVDNVAILLNTLSLAMNRVRTGDGALLLESYLGLSPGDYTDADTLSSRLKRADSPLPHMNPNTAADLLTSLANALHRERTEDAVLLLESYLGLRPEDYVDANVLSSRLQRGDSPLRNLAFEDVPELLRVLAATLIDSVRRKQDARVVLEVLSGGDLPCFIERLVSSDMHVNTVIGIVQAWLLVADAMTEEAFDICERAVWLVHHVRDQQLPTYSHVVDFMEDARKLWLNIKRVMWTRITVHRQTRQMRELEADERRLMVWAEQFENRLLFERLLTYAPKGSDGASLVDGWDPDQWGLRVPWDFDSLQKRLAVKTAMFEPFPAQSTGLLPMALASCLRQDGDTSRAMAAPSGQQTPQSARNRQELLNRDLQNLHALVPPGSLWLRGLFDENGRLLWWASQANGSDLQILARGQGANYGPVRLQMATQTFDMGIERIWAQTLSSPVPADYLEVLNSLPSFLDDPPLAKADRKNLVQVTKRALAELRQRSMQRLAGLGNTILKELMEEFRVWRGHIEVWTQEIEALRTPWPERTACDSARQTGDVDVLSETVRALDLRRRNELDRLSDEHLAALQQELDLTPLWEATGGDFPWAQTDVIFTMPGPLLAMPLAWLDVGGQPLFRRVASTSTVCSLTLREWSAEKREAEGEVSRQLLSAHWDEPDARQHATGLPYLHKQLREIGRSEGWTVWSMGDEPRLTRENFIAGLNDPKKQFGAVVVGAHGNAHRAGVRLALPEDLDLSEFSESAAADVRERLAHWCGEEADLSSVDLLILVCCAVGRLNRLGERDGEGLYAQLVGQGASSVIAARWPIADVEAADLTAEIVREYMQSLGENRQPAPFDRARAFNRARITMLDRNDHRHVTFHQAAAFELYGLG